MAHTMPPTMPPVSEPLLVLLDAVAPPPTESEKGALPTETLAAGTAAVSARTSTPEAAAKLAVVAVSAPDMSAGEVSVWLMLSTSD